MLSNRLPFTFRRSRGRLEATPSAGGLVSALDPVLRARGGTWIGWPGVELRSRDKLPETDAPYAIVPISLTETEVNRYYHGLSNRSLWPLFHSLPARAVFDRRDWEAYRRVNERFAEAAGALAREMDLVWIHDYHLTLTPGLLREAVPDARLAFFLHIPFPPWDIFRLLPWSRDVLQGLLACDVIGFHVGDYVQNFLDCAEKRLGARVDRTRGLIDIGGRVVKVGAFPLGIDFELYETRAKEAPRPRNHGERVVLGVDRLDYTQGIPERIRAFERLLELHPKHRGKVVLLQLAVPSRSQVDDYRDLKREIDELVGRVNGRFATDTWSPIRYLYRAVSPERLAAMYRDADVALVTPLRDGMNLVAKEYVASQVRAPGVLVLSSLAGSAATMREALIVNPNDIDQTAEAIHRALTMEPEERESRMASLRQRERTDDVDSWVQRFLEAATATVVGSLELRDSDFERWLAPFLRRHPLALLLDYDGTLAPIAPHPQEAVLSDEMRGLLADCARRDDTEVGIISGRSLADVRAMVDNEGFVYAGNHGLEIVGPDFDEFRHEDVQHYVERTEALAADLSRVAKSGAWVEPKGPTLTFHFRAVPENRRAEIAERARRIIQDAGYQPRDAHSALEARPPIGWDKGRAVLHVLRTLYGPAWSEHVRVVYVGDDETDEDAFRLLDGLAMTFRVGPADGRTAARRRLPDVEGVRRLLSWLARRSAPFPVRAPRS